MRKRALLICVLFLAAHLWPGESRGDDSARLRLVPFPKQVSLSEGTFELARPLTLHVPADLAGLIGNLLSNELGRAGLPTPTVSPSPAAGKQCRITLAAAGTLTSSGAGGAYVQHILRLHKLLKEKYNKRMMMWGDIILNYPDQLGQIPRDVLMLAWDYRPAKDFEEKVLPFAKSGFEFFVCPGVNGWNRILPDFRAAEINIRNFVRDGTKHGAIGMLNTDWKDDAMSFHSTVWHGAAWGAECAWNGSATAPEDFNRRLGAVLFGESGDHFGQAIALLSKLNNIKGISDQGIFPGRFFDNDFSPSLTLMVTRQSAEQLLTQVRPALEHLASCRKEAACNTELLDGFLNATRRMEEIGQRMLDAAEAIEIYERAYNGTPEQAAPALTAIADLVRKHQKITEELRREYELLWNQQNRPYALGHPNALATNLISQYEQILKRLKEAEQLVAAGKGLPSPARIGLAAEAVGRRTWADQELDKPLMPEAPWAEPSASHRLGLTISAGNIERSDLPIELDLSLPEELRTKPVRAFCAVGGAAQEIPAQLVSKGAVRTRLVLMIPGPIPAQAQVHLYLGLSAPPAALPSAVSTTEGPNGMKWIENNKIRVLLDPESAQIYRWEVKSLGNRDLTQAGEKGTAGFASISGIPRDAKNVMERVADGPALVRFTWTSSSGVVKHTSLFAGVSWMEEMVYGADGSYTNYADPNIYAADSSSPGKYLFSTGKAGAVGKENENKTGPLTEYAAWSLRYNDQRLGLGLATPDRDAHHRIPSAAGLAVDRNMPPHVVILGGILEDDPAKTMNRLCLTLNLRKQPTVGLYSMEKKSAN